MAGASGTSTETLNASETAQSVSDLECQARSCFEDILSFCRQEHKDGFIKIERGMSAHVFRLARLCMQLLLAHAHCRFTYEPWLTAGEYQRRSRLIGRTMKTLFGPVRYWRCYLERKKRGASHRGILSARRRSRLSGGRIHSAGDQSKCCVPWFLTTASQGF